MYGAVQRCGLVAKVLKYKKCAYVQNKICRGSNCKLEHDLTAIFIPVMLTLLMVLMFAHSNFCTM